MEFLRSDPSYAEQVRKIGSRADDGQAGSNLKVRFADQPGTTPFVDTSAFIVIYVVNFPQEDFWPESQKFARLTTSKALTRERGIASHKPTCRD
jgi:hypothetical protein